MSAGGRVVSWPVGGAVVLVLLGCGAGSKQGDAGFDAGSKQEDAGFDAGSCAEQAQAAAASLFSGSCFALDAGSSGDVTFRLRNVSDAGLLVPPHPWFGSICRATLYVSGCQGAQLTASGLTSELCPDTLVSLAPDASVDLDPWTPQREVSTTCGGWSVSLRPGSYQVQFSYALDAGAGLSTTAPHPFTLPANGGVVEVAIP